MVEPVAAVAAELQIHRAPVVRQQDLVARPRGGLAASREQTSSNESDRSSRTGRRSMSRIVTSGPVRNVSAGCRLPLRSASSYAAMQISPLGPVTVGWGVGVAVADGVGVIDGVAVAVGVGEAPPEVGVAVRASVGVGVSGRRRANVYRAGVPGNGTSNA